MSNLNFMEKLLKGVEVEWKLLGDVSNVTIGEFVHQDKQNPSSKYPVYNGGIKPTGYYDKYNNTGNKIIVSARGANAGFVNKMFEPYWAGNSCYSISSKDETQLTWEFIFYFLKSNENKMIGSQQGGGIPSISKKQMESFIIPIPSLNVQNEIVRILDNFTELTTELTIELTARKKQYTYYRDKLLTFEDGEVEFKPLGEVADVGVGSKPKIIYEQLQQFEYINAGTTNSGYSANFNCEGDTVTTPSRGQGGIGFVGYQSDNFWLGPLCYKIKAKKDENVISKYLYYFLEGNNYLILELKKEGGVPAVNRGDLIKLNIPIPPLKEQERIVNILDKFDTLTNSIKEGLPKEIDLRAKQYEYYRDLLLTFPKKNVEA